MKPERNRQIDRIFQAALEREPVERVAFLDEACAGDPSLRREVEALLDSHEQAGSFIEAPEMQVAAPLIADHNNDSIVHHPVGPYRILLHLGSGGTGEVYLAQDSRLGRKVALKILPKFFTRDEQRVRGFKQEARAASALNHPNIITIHEIGETEGRHFIATEYVEGETLRQRLVRSRMSLTEVLDVVAQVASGLAAAHQAGIVHRDIKPENIMLRRDGYVKVLDFGLAKLIEAPFSNDSQAPTQIAAHTDPGTVMGTPNYMSPEQARGQNIDARTDIFSFGVVIYEMIAGRVPFEGETTSDVIAAILDKQPRPLARYEPDLPGEVERVLTKALRKDREERYQNVKDLLSDLKDIEAVARVIVEPGSESMQSPTVRFEPADGSTGMSMPPDDVTTQPSGASPQTKSLGQTKIAGTGKTIPLSQLSPKVHPVISDYHIIRKIGEGGMGVVYEAQQLNPRRLVALKVVRAVTCRDDYQIKLFQREAQALARLKHPGIAIIHESGLTEDGQHFFAMELVRGVGLMDHIAGRRLNGFQSPCDLKQRLELFLKVCEAIEYAHQRGVIHRDLKPSNILVIDNSEGQIVSNSTMGRAEVKVLDFGLARITDPDSNATTGLSEVGQIKGTLPYMSPEQVHGYPNEIEIDVRSDVYSLGVILYEMLLEELPYDVSRSSLLQAIYIICNEVPRSPARVLREEGRRDGKKISHIDRDVETIVLKALEKDPQRRYQNVVGMAEDVRRYLNNQPITARQPSAFYQFSKLVARHKVPSALLAVLFLVLLAFAITMTVERNRALKAEREATAQRDRVVDFTKAVALCIESLNTDKCLYERIEVGQIELPATVQDLIVINESGVVHDTTIRGQRGQIVNVPEEGIHQEILGDSVTAEIDTHSGLLKTYIPLTTSRGQWWILIVTKPPVLN